MADAVVIPDHGLLAARAHHVAQRDEHGQVVIHARGLHPGLQRAGSVPLLAVQQVENAPEGKVGHLGAP
eukprot:13864728-Alexandrium_andersonii.AAC.1